jgi:alkanesulfonate monooxygenase SsuD/methylene tetrahydromethanopterin reductase-like flavin-dependent oxidoreductase (luciferase family)
VQELFFAGERDKAIEAVPDAFADEISLIGPVGRIRERLQEWRKTPVTTLLVGGRNPDQLRTLVDLAQD